MCLTFGYIIHQVAIDSGMIVVNSWTVIYHQSDNSNGMIKSYAPSCNTDELTGLNKEHHIWYQLPPTTHLEWDLFLQKE